MLVKLTPRFEFQSIRQYESGVNQYELSVIRNEL